MNQYVLNLSIIVLLATLAACEPGHHHHQEGAHVHGVVRLNLAIDGEKNLGVELHAPAESIYGFEHTAKSEADKQKQSAAMNQLKNDFASLIGLGANCRVVSSEVEVHSGDHDDHDDNHGHDDEHKHDDDHAHDDGAVSGEHSEVHAAYVYECESAIAGTELRPTLHAAFAGIESIQIQILGDDRQDSSVITRGKSADARIQL